MLAQLAARIQQARLQAGTDPTVLMANEERRIVLGDDCRVQ